MLLFGFLKTILIENEEKVSLPMLSTLLLSHLPREKILLNTRAAVREKNLLFSRSLRIALHYSPI